MCVCVCERITQNREADYVVNNSACNTQEVEVALENVSKSRKDQHVLRMSSQELKDGRRVFSIVADSIPSGTKITSFPQGHR